MMHVFKKILSTVVALMSLSAPILSPQMLSPSISLVANAAEGDKYTYTYSGVKCEYLKDDEVASAGVWVSRVLTANPQTIVIPSSITISNNGKTETAPVIGIMSDFAAGITTLKTLTIPSSIQKIGQGVAKNCTKLETVNFNTNKVTELDNGFLQNTTYANNLLNNKKSVYIGEWLLQYNPNSTSSTVKVSSLGNSAKPITKIARKAFHRCSKSLTTLDLQNVTHICYLGLGTDSNNIATLNNTTQIEWVEMNSVLCTAWFKNAIKQQRNSKNYKPMVLGKVLYYIPDEADRSVPLDLSGAAYNNVTTITCQLSGYKSYWLPKNFKKFSGYKPITNLELNPNATDPNKVGVSYLYYYNKTSGKWVDLKTVMVNNIDKGTALNAGDNEFINNNFMVLTGGSNTHNSLTARIGYIDTITGKLAIKFLKEKCGIDTTKKATDAWSQYQIISNVACGMRDNIKYKHYCTGGSGNAASELVFHRGIVCRDYADLFNYFMYLMGITAEYVTSVDEGHHAWSAVKIIDTKTKQAHWFNIDTTNLWLETFLTSDDTFKGITGQGYMFWKNASDQKKYDCSNNRGDINGDSIIDVEDAQLALDAYTDEMCGCTSSLSHYQKVLADVNCDGKITAEDAQLILSYYVKSRVSQSFNGSLEAYIISLHIQVPDPNNPKNKIDARYPNRIM